MSDRVRLRPDFLGDVLTGSVAGLVGSGDSLGDCDFAWVCATVAPPTPRLRSFGFGAAGLTSLESPAGSSESEPCKLITLPLTKADNGATVDFRVSLTGRVTRSGDLDCSLEDIS
jgi:hypothetical protein